MIVFRCVFEVPDRQSRIALVRVLLALERRKMKSENNGELSLTKATFGILFYASVGEAISKQRYSTC